MRRINTTEAPAAVGPYSQGIVTGNLLYTAGQIALTAEGQLIKGSIEEETHQVMTNLKAILGAAGCRFANVVQTRVYITDMELFPRVNEVYAQYFPKDEVPVRECVVAAPPLEGAHVEMSMIAEVPTITYNEHC
jgi:2-iminobutanoate/2-iminopropanoate deaminase